LELSKREAEQALRQKLQLQAEHRRRLALGSAGAVFILLAISVALFIGLRKAWAERDLQRRYAYAADMNLASQALEESNLGRVRELLNRHNPQGGQTDLRGWEWRHFWRRSGSDELLTLGAHSNVVRALAISSNGSRLATAGFDKQLKIWDLDRRTEIALFSVTRRSLGSILARRTTCSQRR
jgi:hypothetical protein